MVKRLNICLTNKQIYKDIIIQILMEYKQFKGEKLKALLLLYFSRYTSGDSDATFSDFEEELEINKGHPDIRKLFRYLLEIDAFVISKQIHSITTYYVNKKMLQQLIEAQEVLKLHIKYIDKTAVLWK